MKIEKMKSLHPVTEFSPTWCIPFGFEQWTEVEKINNIRNWLIKNEKRILESLPAHHDGGTGLGNESTTSRFGMYNLFDFKEELPELNDLLTFFRIFYLQFINREMAEIRNVDIMCWFNILRKDEHIEEHSHDSSNSAYLSGNIHLDNYKTSTYYKNIFDKNVQFETDNTIGGATIFPSWVPHLTNKFDEDGLRLSIAFDLRLTGKEENEYLNARPFMNKEIYETLIKGL